MKLIVGALVILFSLNVFSEEDEAVQEIFNSQCVYCHMEGVEQAGLNLEPGLSRTRLVGVKSTQTDVLLVTPGNPSMSYLWHKLQNTHLQSGGEGTNMPMNQPPLSASELKSIEEWINSLLGSK